MSRFSKWLYLFRGTLIFTGMVIGSTLPLYAATTLSAPTGIMGQAGDSQATISFSTVTSATSYTAKCITGSTTKYNTGSSSPITVVSLVNGSSYSCSVTASATGYTTSSSSSSVSVSPTTVSTPANFKSILAKSYYTSSLTIASGFTSRNRYLLSNMSSASTSAAYLSIGSIYSSTAGYSVTSGTLDASANYNKYLSAMMNAISDRFIGIASLSGTTLTVSSVTEGTLYVGSVITTSNDNAFTSATITAFGTGTGGTGTYTVSSTSNTLSSTTVSGAAPSSNLYFRLDSQLHPNMSIDADSLNSYILKFRDNFGHVSGTPYGYVVFSYDNTTKYLIAKKRYSYTYTCSTTCVEKHTPDSSFGAANYYVNYSNGVYKLVASISSATPIYLFNAPLTVTLPTDFNPLLASYSIDPAAPFVYNSSSAPSYVEGTSGDVYKRFGTNYKTQVTSPGTNTSTETAAKTQLAAIKSTGVKLRYDTSVYVAFRKALLANTLVSASITDGTPGQNMVPYVWFTNEKDSSNVYHPFMVIVTYENQSSPNGLIDIVSPPGASGCTGWCRTRLSNLDYKVLRIPMKDYGTISSSVTENSIMDTIGTLWSDITNTQSKNVYNYASKADNGILVDGAVTFPAYNNQLGFSQAYSELSPYGCHVGQGGGGPHCHADSYRSSWPFGIYNAADYPGKTHPPLIGFGYDGVALFGAYLSDYSTMLGYNTLDSFGGHNHSGIGYHYHAHTMTGTTSNNTSYTLHILMKGAYIGLVNSVPCFNSASTSCTGQILNKFTYGN